MLPLKRTGKATIATLVILVGLLLVLPLPFRGPVRAWTDLETWTKGSGKFTSKPADLAASLTGVENADEIRMGNDGPLFLTNHAGGILGGISTGQPVVCRFAVKPTSSILTPRATVNSAGQEVDLVTKGRHDPCVGIRAVPVGEAMMALVILDHLLLDRGQTGGVRGVIG